MTVLTKLLGKMFRDERNTVAILRLRHLTLPLPKKQEDLAAKVAELETKLAQLSQQLDTLTGKPAEVVARRSGLILGATALVLLVGVFSLSVLPIFNRSLDSGPIAMAFCAAIFTGYGAYADKNTAARLRQGGQVSVAEMGRIIATGSLFNTIAVVLLIISSAWQFAADGPLFPKHKERPQPSVSASASALTSPQIYLRCLPPPRQSGVWIYKR